MPDVTAPRYYGIDKLSVRGLELIRPLVQFMQAAIDIRQLFQMLLRKQGWPPGAWSSEPEIQAYGHMQTNSFVRRRSQGVRGNYALNLSGQQSPWSFEATASDSAARMVALR